MRANHAEIAMSRLGGMHKKRGRTRARQRCGEFARNMAGFADAGHDRLADAAEQQFNRIDKVLTQALRKRAHRGRFRFNDLTRQFQRSA